MFKHTAVLSALVLLAAACNDPGATAPSNSLPDGMMASPATSASRYAILANAAVTCTDGTIIGDVGTSQAAPTGSITLTSCPVTGTTQVGTGAAVQAYNDFLATYAATTPVPSDNCTVLSGTLADVTLAPGTYCFPAAAALTGTLTLDGPSNGVWIFQVGTLGTGALTGTDFNVVLANGATACNVTWWVAQAVTMTTSNFVGNILAGAGITFTGGTFAGNAWSQADVTVTGTAVTGCEGRGTGGRTDRRRCNQGVGNGPEGCDPGNSDHKHGSNDETGGIPGTPGRP